jgi:hypothetical protein
MATKIAHAVGDENGKARGGKAGDQTGKEILVTNWYKRTGGWEVYLECTDKALAKIAADFAVRIANDDSFGYDQDQRKTAYKAILAAGGNIEAAADSELDCSVLVFIAYKLAGLDIEIGYTGNLEARFLATGLFIAHREPKYLTSGDYATVGGIYLTSGKHTAIVVTNGSKPDSYDESVPDETDGSGEADEIDPPYVQIKGKVNVRNMGGWTLNDKGKKVYNGKIIYTAKNERLPFEEYDDDSGWWGVMSPAGAGFVSCDLPKNAILVEK